ncbi:regulatory protein RecX [Nocardioides marmoriginsengisoli]|uniref:Regulatory protein RecX n=1 Tax=Nocardioides marmoriginsengisoli TaxID=661483 RepID=A0A3N0CQX7_9ACTN|nr:regulatory protein RecX [Nocardioides marmoriginsengisoli]RNL65436.1 regulatory protein RecX [Nocardioides marmoriginsengisoli]
MASLSDPQAVADLFGVAHEPINLAVGTPERSAPGAEEAAGPSARRGSGRARRHPGRGRRSAEPPPEGDADLGPEADPVSVGRKILLDQLTGRARSRADLAKKLAERNVPDDVALGLLDRFEEVGLIDDAAFAREWVAQRQEGRGLARRALAQELRRKGIDDELAREALDTVEEEDEIEAARLLVQRKLRSMRGLDKQVAIRRLVGMLARKGYSSGVSFRVVREELDADLADPEL